MTTNSIDLSNSYESYKQREPKPLTCNLENRADKSAAVLHHLARKESITELFPIGKYNIIPVIAVDQLGLSTITAKILPDSSIVIFCIITFLSSLQIILIGACFYM